MTNAVYLASLVNSTGYNVTLSGASVSSGTGVAFPATQSASSDANTLDDYEEGTFTPSLTFGGASVGITYSTRTFEYVKIGRQVTISGELTLTSKGSSTGTAQLTGLPFTATSGNGGYGSGCISYANSMTFTGVLGIVSIPSATTAGFQLLNNGSQSTPTNTAFSNGTDLLISITYLASA